MSAKGTEIHRGCGRSVAIGKEAAGCIYGGSLRSDIKRPKIPRLTKERFA